MKLGYWATLILILAVSSRGENISSSPQTQTTAPAATKAKPEEAVWMQLLQAGPLPSQPAAWATHPPTAEQQQTFLHTVWQTLDQRANAAKDFYTQHPQSPHAFDAQKMEFNLIRSAVQNGDTNKVGAWAAAEAALINDSRLSANERFTLRVDVIQREGMDPRYDQKTRIAQVGASLRALVKDYPQNNDACSMLLNFAVAYMPPAEARASYQDILITATAPGIQSQAREMLAWTDNLGKPLNIKFTALDGTPVDLAQMKGKVVLVDFWATWCGPCMEEVPQVKSTYDALHAKGFEVVGISLDTSEASVRQVTQAKGMVWPQYFAGPSGKNEFAQQYGIANIPTMWLVDKQGNLRDLNARQDLAGKVEKLLVE